MNTNILPTLAAGYRWLRHHVTLRAIRLGGLPLAGAVVILAVVVAALAAPLLPYDPTKANFDELLLSPTWSHWLGTDNLGRDTLTRVIYGARVSLTVGAISVSFAAIVGTTIGLTTGYFRGWIDVWVQRVIDAILAIPPLILALGLATAVGVTGMTSITIALAVVFMPRFARLARAEALRLGEADFVEAARALGARSGRIIMVHILPNALAPLVVYAFLTISVAIIAEAGLSFVGLGVRPPQPSWGAMVGLNRIYMETSPWTVFSPAVAIFLTVFALNFAGDGLRNLLDPRSSIKR